MKSIRTKILCVNFIAMLIVIVCIGGMGVYTVDYLARKEAAINLKLICESKKEILDSIFDGIEQAVNVATMQALEELYENDSEGVNEAFTEHMLGLFGNLADQTEGAVSYYLRYNPELEGPTAGFFWSKEKGEKVFLQYPCTDLYAYPKEDVEHVGWYYIPVEAKKAMWLEPYENRNNDMFLCSYVTPVYYDGELIGVIGMDIDIASIMDIVNETNIYSSGYGYLINEKEQIVFHKDFESGADKPALTEDIFEYQIRLGNGTTLVMTVNQAEIYATRDHMTRNIIVFAFIAMIACSLYSVWITGWITKPIIALTNALKGFGKGEYEADLDVKRDDEIGILTRNFLDTSRFLQTYTSHINSLAYRDSLTGIRNVTAYKEAVELLESKMQKGYSDFGVIALDTNGLKQINDQFGHEAGDALLIGATKLICSVFKHSPVFRTGGDEFTVILEDVDYQNREELLDQLDEKMKQTYFEYQGTKYPIYVAKGLAVCKAGVDQNYAQIYKRADDAMYINKARMKAEPDYKY